MPSKVDVSEECGIGMECLQVIEKPARTGILGIKHCAVTVTIRDGACPYRDQ